jgi:maleylpyruvate isomerase
MRLYSYWRSSASWRVRIVLAHKKIDYEYVPVSIAPDRNEQHGEGFGEVNALRQVPVLEWMQRGTLTRLTQSVAIVEHLEAIHPSPQLMPDDPLKRARVRELVEIVNSGVQPLQNTAVTSHVRKLAGDDAAAAWAKEANLHGMTTLEAHLRAHGGRHAVGDTLTLADVFLVPQVYNATRFGVDVTKFPRVVEIAARAGELPAFVAAHPEQQPDAARKAAS